MRVIILGAETGGGHKSVMSALSEQFRNSDVIVEEYPAFYENLYESNRILSDFYNMTMARSLKLSVFLNEIMIMEGQKQRERLYRLYFKSLYEFLEKRCDIIISVSSLINYHIIRILNEQVLNYTASFYVVVTDPYDPIYPGFDTIGATKYFCPTKVSKKQLIKAGISDDRIFTYGYPVKSEFMNINDNNAQTRKAAMGIDNDIVIMINCGATGSFTFCNFIFDIVKKATHIHFIIVCGKNQALFSIVKQKLKYTDNCSIFGFVDNIVKLYEISDFCITKPGANAIFESLMTKTIPIVYSFEGLMYQEQGIYNFLQNEVGIDLKFINEEYLKDYIINKIDKKYVDKVKQKISSYKQEDAAKKIVENILMDNMEKEC